jgi:hypothetical protein
MDGKNVCDLVLSQLVGISGISEVSKIQPIQNLLNNNQTSNFHKHSIKNKLSIVSAVIVC